MPAIKDTLSRIGVYVFPWGKRPPTVESVVRLTRHMEALGLDSVQMPWHFTLPPDRFNWGNRFLLDPLVVLPAMVAATSRIRIGLNSGLLPLVHPFFWAQYLASLDVMSGGRTIAGLALGWWEEDFRVGGAPLKERGKRSDEALDIVTRLWRGQPIETAGTFWDARGLAMDPRPSPRMPLWIGGGEKSIERAARYAEGLNPLNPSLEEIRTVLRPGLDAAAERHGRPRPTLAIFNYCVVIEPSDSPSWVREELIPTLRARLHGKEPDDSIVWGTPEQCAERLGKLFSAGADYILFDGNLHGWLPEEFSEEQMSRFVERVVPLLGR
jgi:alkanesulfonate monooxygenase SsuD/methylene tetrahydromethanopterin reductase-like flavin-dependent oxidoreductase (luciferase family)